MSVLGVRRTGALLASALLALGAGGAAQGDEGDSLAAQARAAWDGAARGGTWTELAIRLVSPRGGRVELAAAPQWETAPGAASAVPSRWSGEVEAGVPRSVRLPVWLPPEAEGAPLRLELDAGSAAHSTLRVPLRWLAPAERVVAVPSAIEPQLASRGDGVRPIHRVGAGPASVPAHPRSFEVADALVLDAATLAALDPEQLAAFEAHLGRCGRVVVVGVGEPAIRRGRRLAGCGGAHFRWVAGSREVEAALDALLSAQVAPLPDARRLAEVFESGRPTGAGTALVGFFALYAASLVAAGAFRRAPLSYVALAVGAALLLGAALWISPEARSAAVWVQLPATSDPSEAPSVARFSALLQLGGTSPGRLRLGLPEVMGLPSSSENGGASAHRFADGSGPAVEMEVDLLSASALHWMGSIRWRPPLALQMQGADPRVWNRGEAASPAATLLWSGQAFAVPPLEAGQSWAPTAAEPLDPTRLPRWLARRRRVEEGASLAWAEVPAVLAEALHPATASGWTVIHGEGS
ncbi:MAG: hypothetical protein ACQGVK_01270 [Myxococcota bacterium]